MEVQDYIDKFFTEYKIWAAFHTDEMTEELERWESVSETIRDMNLTEQASYCDYVIKKICALDQKIIQKYATLLRSQMQNLIKQPVQRLNTAAIGNLAAILLALDDTPIKDELTSTYDILMKRGF